MDVQLKRGLLDVCVLAAIKDEDSYGYKIIKDMKHNELIGVNEQQFGKDEEWVNNKNYFFIIIIIIIYNYHYEIIDKLSN